MFLDGFVQVSEDLVPVNIACVADNPELVFHITAYNSQVLFLAALAILHQDDLKIRMNRIMAT